VVRTTIGFGAPNKQGTCEAHGSPLGASEVVLTKRQLGFDPARTFEVSSEASARFRAGAARGARARAAWLERFTAYQRAHPELAREFQRRMRGELPEGFLDQARSALPRYAAGSAVATRDAGGKAENALAKLVPELFGGDADLSSSTKTRIEGAGDFEGQSGSGRNLRFGVREHAMGAIGNGLLYHGGLRAFVSTFFVFSDYMRPAVRVAALARLPLVCVWTHDSVAVGEDGPTHQPIEHLAALRAMPNLHVFRPADAHETNWAWVEALRSRHSPCALVLSRQKLPVLEGTAERAEQGVARGAYVLQEASGGRPSLILIATGSEVALAVAARAELEREGVAVRVVSMPCWSLFSAQDPSWREQVLPSAVTARVSIEAGSTFGWERWVGSRGAAIGIDRFGASAPGETVLAQLGLRVEALLAAARAVLAR
jgi:transketolase